MQRLKDAFARIAEKAAQATGSFWAFSLALAVIIVWALTGPLFGFSETWQLIINTGTTIVTFLMVFLIQHAQKQGEPGPAAQAQRAHRGDPAAPRTGSSTSRT